MPPYRTPPGPLPTGRATLDIGGAIDSIIGGSSNLIQGIYLRKQAKLEGERQAVERAAAQARQAQLDDERRREWEAEFGLRRDAAERESRAADDERYAAGYRTGTQMRHDIAAEADNMVRRPAALRVPRTEMPELSGPAGVPAPAYRPPQALRIPESLQPPAALSPPRTPHLYTPLPSGDYLDQERTPAAIERHHEEEARQAREQALIDLGIEARRARAISFDATATRSYLDEPASGSGFTIGATRYDATGKPIVTGTLPSQATAERSRLDRQISTQQAIVRGAEAALPKGRPPETEPLMSHGKVLVPADTAMLRGYLSDSTAKAGTLRREQSTLQAMRTRRGDTGYASTNDEADALYAAAVADIRARRLAPDEETAALQEVDDLYQQAIGAAP